ncbi:MAG TPA: PorP/SprF family type IX secretion system membrane protein [Bacteroidales bacterium]|nr:PorP/SprF family type IX secretion system membrane protein [Bacteroidales bacterium]
MKKLLTISAGILMATLLGAQQIPISENYFMDRYSLAPSYAGNHNAKYLMMGYRSDWTGIDGGPKTARLSYNDVFPFMKNAGYGGKIIYDKAGIFSQLYLLASYSYNLALNEDHHILFGLSMGAYKNRLNLTDYYNDPGYSLDPSLISQDINSKLKFMSDFSAVWTWNGAEAGISFSNITVNDASYKDVNLKYSPLANFQFHAAYLYSFSDDWDVEPLAIVRSGKYIKSQFELASQVVYIKKFRGSLVYRDPGIIGVGAGMNLDKGLQLGYNFNLATNVTMGAFNNHEISLGLNIFESMVKTK